MNTYKRVVIIFLTSYFFFNIFAVVQAQTDGSEETRIVTNGTITEVEQIDDTLFAGGSFSEVTLEDTKPVARNNLVEIDMSTGQISSWNPDPNAPVQDITSYENKLYIGGQFTTINAEDQPYFAVIDVVSRDLQRFPLSFNKPVYALSIKEDVLYIGGEFTELNTDIQRTYIASYNLKSDTLTTWGPALNGTVYDIAVDNEIIYIAGAFTEVNGEERTYLAAFDLETGELLEWNPIIDAVVTKIEISANTIIVTGYQKLSDTVIGKKITIEKDTGSVLSEEPITLSITPPIQTGNGASPPGVESSIEPADGTVAGLMVDTKELGFQIPTLSDILTFAIRAFFVIAGLAALFFLLLGAFSWVTSGGDEESIAASRNKIQAAVIGLIMMVAVLGIVWTLEQVVFAKRVCFGISCPVTIPSLLEPI